MKKPDDPSTHVKVLVVDDEALIRRSVARAFRMRGAEATEAVDGEDALKQISQASEWDIILIDMLMPGPNGSEVIQQAQQQHLFQKLSKPPVVYLMSAFAGQDGEAIARSLGIQGFLAKPFEDIFKIVDTALDLARSRT